MRIAVISDTHGQVQTTRDAIRLLENLEVERVLHCGDIGSAEVVRLFSRWPTDFVLGNCDWEQAALAGAIEETGNTLHGRLGELEIESRRIALLHGDDHRQFAALLREGTWDLICHGHTHQATIERHGFTRILNPGAIHRAYPPSFALLELPRLEATIVPL